LFLDILKDSLEDTLRAIRSLDDNGIARLDLAEFRHILSLFAVTNRFPLIEVIDFMVVTSALKDNVNGSRTTHIRKPKIASSTALWKQKHCCDVVQVLAQK
jgi:hypothetical protein